MQKTGSLPRLTLRPANGDKRRHLLHIFPSFAIGGGQSRLLQLIRAYGDTYSHTIVALDGCYDMAARMPNAAPIQYLDAKIGKRDGLAAIMQIRSVIAAVCPDVLITYNWGAIEWAFVNRLFSLARHIHIEDGFGLEERDRQFRRRVLFRYLALRGRRTVVVLPSRTLIHIATQQWRLPVRSLRYISNGIDCARFAVSRKPSGQGEPLIVGTVASLRPEKNLTRLIRAFALARADRLAVNLQLLIVGDGCERGALQEYANEVGCAEAVIFVGATDKPETYLAQMSIFAMSSDTEQMPLTVLEAMASGLPVVSTDVGDIADMVSSDNLPYVTKLCDEWGLRRSLVALIDSASTRAALGHLNREKAFANFNFTEMASKYAELFD
jgi:glycosyltransferase involved in cell wall biosynthesis